MGGGLVQLYNRGPHDEYLMHDDGHSFWKQRYARHTNFAIESKQQELHSNDVGYGTKTTCSIVRGGDLATNLIVEITMRKGSGETLYCAEHFLKNIDLEIGGVRCDTITNTWLRIYDELYRPIDAREGYRRMTDFVDSEPVGAVKRFYVPIPFWFSTGDPSTALPMISLQHHEVKLDIETERAENIPGIDPTYAPTIRVWADFIYLEDCERRWFAHMPLNYLVEQTQMQRESITLTDKVSTRNIALNFNHAVKYVVVVLKPSELSHGVFAGSGNGLEYREFYGPVDELGIQINGQDRFDRRKGSYFRLQHPLTHFGQAPSVGIYVYSFGLRPRSAEPTGTLNSSRADDVRLIIQTKAASKSSYSQPYEENDTAVSATSLKTVEVYARNFNILQIKKGMAGMKFMN